MVVENPNIVGQIPSSQYGSPKVRTNVMFVKWAQGYRDVLNVAESEMLLGLSDRFIGQNC